MFYASMNKGTGGIVFGLVVSACVSSVCVSRKVVTTIFHKSGALKTNMNRLDFEVQGQRSKVKVMIRPNNGQKGGSIRIDGSLLRSSLYYSFHCAYTTDDVYSRCDFSFTADARNRCIQTVLFPVSFFGSGNKFGTKLTRCPPIEGIRQYVPGFKKHLMGCKAQLA